MPYIYDEQKKDDQQQQENSTNETVISGAAPQQASGTASTQSEGAGTSSGQFVNPQKYIEANAGQKFGQQVAGKVANSANEATSAQNTAEQGFRDLVDQNRVRPNQELIKNAFSQPTQFVQNQQNVTDFQKLRDANYGGPHNLADNADLYSPAAEKTDKARQLGEATKSEEGRMAVLKDLYNRPTYQRGQQTLDNLLLQNDPNSRSAFADAQNQTQQSWDKFQGLKSLLSGYATDAANETAQTRADTRAALGINDMGQVLEGQGALGGAEKALADKVAEQYAKTGDTEAALKYAAANQDLRQLSPELRQLLGLDSLGSLYGTDLTKYYSTLPQATVRPETVGNIDELSKLNALHQLAGDGKTYDTAAAGTADDEPLASFNKDQFMQDWAGKKKNVEDSIYGQKLSNIDGTQKNYYELLDQLAQELGVDASSTNPYDRQVFEDRTRQRFEPLLQQYRDMMTNYMNNNRLKK